MSRMLKNEYLIDSGASCINEYVTSMPSMNAIIYFTLIIVLQVQKLLLLPV